MSRLRTYSIIACLILAASCYLANELRAEGRLWTFEPTGTLEARFLADGVDGQLQQFSLFDGSVVASGIASESELETYRASIASKRNELKGLIPPEAKVLTRARIALEFLHDRILTGKYRAECTQVPVGIDRGDFNCVSATILFLDLCRCVGVTAVPVATPTHVFAQVEDGRFVDVQTTFRRGLSSGQADNSVARGSPSDRRRQRVLSDAELLAKVYYNRGVVLLDRREFSNALPMLLRSEQLDSRDENTRENILAAINNWSLAEANSGNFEKASELLRNGIQRHPHYEPFLANDLHIHQKWSLALTEQRRFDEAIAVLNERHQARPGVEMFDAGRFSLYRMWGQDLLNSGRVIEAQTMFRDLREKYPERPETGACESGAFAAAAQIAIQKGDMRQAQQVLDAGLSLQPQAQRLRQLRDRLTPVNP